MVNFIPYAFAIILAASGMADGLRCYKCNSNDNAVCSYGIASFTYNTEECASAGFVDNLISQKCFKITAENKEGKEYIARGCLPPATIGCSAIANAVGWLSDHTDPNGLRNLNCETCTTDKCNSAEKVTGMALIALIVATFAFLL